MPKTLPEKLPENGDFAPLFAWLNRLRDAVESLQPRRSFGTDVTHTAVGVFRKGAPVVTTPKQSGGQFWL